MTSCTRVTRDIHRWSVNTQPRSQGCGFGRGEKGGWRVSGEEIWNS